MPTKTKKVPPKSEKLLELAQQASMILMTAAVTLGMTELPGHPDKRIVLPNQPAFAWANDKGESNNNNNYNNTLRRESQETEQHYISYSVAQRTPARSGRT
jgi:hypothetical protein